MPPEKPDLFDFHADIISLREQLQRSLAGATGETLRLMRDQDERLRQAMIDNALTNGSDGVPLLDVELLRLCADPALPDRQRTLAVELMLERAQVRDLYFIATNASLPSSLRDLAIRAMEHRVLEHTH